MLLLSCASSTRPESAHSPIVAGSGSARGIRGPPRIEEPSAGPSARAAMHLLERDEIPVGIAHHEPARAPAGLLRREDDFGAGREPLEPRVDVVDVEVHD